MRWSTRRLLARFERWRWTDDVGCFLGTEVDRSTGVGGEHLPEVNGVCWGSIEDVLRWSEFKTSPGVAFI